MIARGAHLRYKGLPVLVTGGMGFIGSNLIMALVELGAEVAAVDAQVPGCGWRPQNLESVCRRIHFEKVDIQDREAMRPLVLGRRVIFNLAGEVSHISSMSNPLRDLAINCGAQVGFLELCRRENPQATIVYASSRQIYGRPQYLPVDELHPVHPVDYNGVHKHAAEQYHFLLRQQFGIRTICLRLGNIYGPRQAIHQDCRGFMDTFIHAALAGEPITVYGDGRQLRGMTYVDDAVDAFLLAGMAGPAACAAYNAGHPEPVSLWEIAILLARMTGGPLPQRTPFPKERQVIDIGDFFQNTEKIRRDFGWEPRVGLEDGLSRTLQFFQAEDSRPEMGDPQTAHASTPA